MVLRRILGRSNDPIVWAERCKMVANGCQTIAITVVVGAIFAPMFNSALHPGPWARIGGGVAAAVIELLALRVMGYISSAPSKED